jgi:hypothetical protein
MTREEAVAESARLGRESADRANTSWFPRQEESGGWTVVRVPRPGPALNRDELRTGLDEDPHPDPSQDVPREPNPYWGLG